MANRTGLIWRGLRKLADMIRRQPQMTLRVAGDLAQEVAAEALADMRQMAPWTDQTGEARRTLYAAVQIGVKTVEIVLGHGVVYGIYLELSNGGRFAIVGPTLERYGPILMRRVQARL